MERDEGYTIAEVTVVQKLYQGEGKKRVVYRFFLDLFCIKTKK